MVESESYATLTDKERRSLLRRAIVRPIATALALTVLYFVVPMQGIRDIGTVLLLTLVLAAVVLVCVWQVTKVLKADYPAIQAIEALAAVVPVYLIGFSAVYYLIAAASELNFNEPVTRVGSLYFTLSVFSTVGFGDITASTDFARAIVTLQMVGNLVFVALGGRLLVAAVRRGQARRSR
ncbi:potassium channel family protein [Rhodococcoides yunnanense]|uniref:potassium channel family protein n=1 Tax=Rhodococcoides yunnanense TaxID=278209 RepID=UPI00093316C6|nr:potassium channel family protein [Rhodococcus yunnanensis]